MLINIINFCCGFFLINNLWIPPKNVFNIYRLSVWFILFTLSIKELYNDVATWCTDYRIKNPVSGKCRWLTFFIAFVETFCCIKFTKGAGNIVSDFETPIYIWLPWVIATVSSICYYLYLRRSPHRTRIYP